MADEPQEERIFPLSKPMGMDLGQTNLGVSAVKQGGPADLAGVKEGWVVRRVGEHRVGDFKQFAAKVMEQRAAGKTGCSVVF